MRRLSLVPLLPLLLLAACGGTEAPPVAPSVTSTVPANAATGVAVNLPITATFDRVMDAASLSATTFVIKQGDTVVPGTVTYTGTTATFTPTSPLAGNTTYTATLTPGSKDAAGVALAEAHSWTFTTVAVDAPPDLSGTKPLDAAPAVWAGSQLSATFNQAMDPASLNVTTFTVVEGTTPVTGAVSYDAATNTARFTPSLRLGDGKTYTATISTGAKSAAGLNLEEAHSWTFTTRAANVGPNPVNLGTAGNYVILAQTKISTEPISAITGDIAVSPAAATYITGFDLIADSTNSSATSTQVTGTVYAADQTSPTSSNLTTAIGDMGIAFTDAASRPADVTEFAAGDLSGTTLAPGVYKWGTGVLIAGDVHLAGSATDVWIFEIAQDITMASGKRIFLDGGAVAKNVFWQVSGLVDIGTGAHFEGIILSQTAIIMKTGSSINGRLLAQTAVTLDQSTVKQPAP